MGGKASKLNDKPKYEPQKSPSRFFNDAVDYEEKGNESYQQGQYEAAVDSFSVAIERAPFIDSEKLSTLYKKRGDCYKQLGKYDLALKDYDASIRLTPFNPYPYLYKAQIYAIQGSAELADKNFAQALKYAKDNTEIKLAHQTYLDEKNASSQCNRL